MLVTRRLFKVPFGAGFYPLDDKGREYISLGPIENEPSKTAAWDTVMLCVSNLSSMTKVKVTHFISKFVPVILENPNTD